MKKLTLRLWKDFAEISWPSINTSVDAPYRVRDNRGQGGARANSVELRGAYKKPTLYNRFMIWPEDEALARFLAKLAYHPDDPADFLYKTLSDEPKHQGANITSEITPELQAFWECNEQDAARVAIMKRAKCDKFFVTIGRDEIQGACYIAYQNEQAYLYALAVSGEDRGKGIGRALCQSAIGEAYARGVKEMAVMVRPDNLIARSLYDGLGFRKISSYYFMVK